jgi:hypothetical protein
MKAFTPYGASMIAALVLRLEVQPSHPTFKLVVRAQSFFHGPTSSRDSAVNPNYFLNLAALATGFPSSHTLIFLSPYHHIVLVPQSLLPSTSYVSLATPPPRGRTIAVTPYARFSKIRL